MLLEDNIYDVSINVIRSFKIEKFNIKFCINLIEQASKFSQWRIRYEAIKKLKEIISLFIENKETNININS